MAGLSGVTVVVVCAVAALESLWAREGGGEPVARRRDLACLISRQLVLVGSELWELVRCRIAQCS